MHTNVLNFALMVMLLLPICSCKKEEKKPGTVVFNVGFESLKNNQGICSNKITGDEEVYFFNPNFNPGILFYDLEGNLKDSLSLRQAEDSIGRIGRLTVIQGDTMIAVSYQTNLMAGLKRDGSFLFTTNLDSLSRPTDQNRYKFWGSFIPSPICLGNDIFFLLIWDDKYQDDFRGNSRQDYYKHIIINRMQSPALCKIESIFDKSPRIKYALRNYYYDRSPELISYGLTEKNYVVLNNRLFIILANNRNMYELDVNTLNIKDTIPIVPQKYKIPTGVRLTGKDNVSEDMMAEQELKDKCRVTNLLYSDSKKQFYVFLKTAKDPSSIDELGYAFQVYVYDENFNKKKEYSFNTDQYNPKTAMMTSKGIMIEKINKEQDYGKKIFEFMDL